MKIQAMGNLTLGTFKQLPGLLFVPLLFRPWSPILAMLKSLLVRYLLRPCCVVGAPAVVGSLKIVYIIFVAGIPAVAKVSVLWEIDYCLLEPGKNY
jgi:hypothetical protein